MQKSMICNTYRYRALFISSVLISFILAVYCGFSLPDTENCIIIPVDPFSDSNFIGTVVSICAFDVAVFWLFSFPLNRTLTVASSAMVFFLRGLIVGNSLGMICANSVSFEIVLMFCAFCVITIIALMYDIALNLYERKNPFLRLLSCMIVTGAVVLIRVSAVLFS